MSWVRQAWLDIQNSARWRFLYRPFPDTAALVAGTACYDGTSLGIEDLASWIISDPASGPSLSLYDPDEGVADQQDVFPTDYQLLERRYLFGDESENRDRPLEVAINDQNQLCFGPVPDKAYRLVDFYVRTPQILERDDDVPIMPARYHEAIKWQALRLLAEFDEADTLVLQTADLNYRSYASAMRRDLLRRGGPYIDFDGGLGSSLGGRSFGTGAFGPPPTTGFG